MDSSPYTFQLCNAVEALCTLSSHSTLKFDFWSFAGLAVGEKILLVEKSPKWATGLFAMKSEGSKSNSLCYTVLLTFDFSETIEHISADNIPLCLSGYNLIANWVVSVLYCVDWFEFRNTVLDIKILKHFVDCILRYFGKNSYACLWEFILIFSGVVSTCENIYYHIENGSLQ